MSILEIMQINERIIMEETPTVIILFSLFIKNIRFIIYFIFILLSFFILQIR